MTGRKRVHSGVLLSILGAFLVLMIVVSTGLGYIHISPAEVIRIVIGTVLGRTELPDGIASTHPVIILQVRLPRIITSAVVGAGLSMAGVVFQGILLNPLADPYTLGVSAGAAFGASIALLFGFGLMGPYAVPLFAFLGALLTLGVVIWLASTGERFSSQNLILSGVIVAAILAAGIGLIKYLADEQVAVIIFWLMGSFVSKGWLDVAPTLVFVVLGSCVVYYYARDLNIMALGERSAASLGVRTVQVRLTLLIAASLVTSVCVAVSGIIGFVGLIIPHLMRFLVGPDNRVLLPASALAGAILLLGADTITRVVLPQEIPIGILTALIGGPYFCYIFRKRQIGRTYG